MFRGSYVHNNLRRTIEDLGVLVDGNEVYYYANPGEGNALYQPTSGATEPFPMPKAKRIYDAMEFRSPSALEHGSAARVTCSAVCTATTPVSPAPTKSPAGRTAQVSLHPTSSLRGDIARPGGNANRRWDIDEIALRFQGNLDPQGRLATDRPHVFKLLRLEGVEIRRPQPI